jgi:hypothetical protein
MSSFFIKYLEQLAKYKIQKKDFMIEDILQMKRSTYLFNSRITVPQRINFFGLPIQADSEIIWIGNIDERAHSGISQAG